MYFNQIEFGRRLQELRKMNRITQEELAVKVGVDKLHISRMERGVAACSIDLLLELSVQYGLKAARRAPQFSKR